MTFLLMFPALPPTPLDSPLFPSSLDKIQMILIFGGVISDLLHCSCEQVWAHREKYSSASLENHLY